MNKTLIGAIVAVVVVVGAVMLFNQNDSNGTNPTPTPAPAPSPTPAPTPSPNPTEVPPPAPVSTAPVEIVMTDSGYTPSTVTVKKGTTVTFKNNGTKLIWPASAPHPTHTDYPAFDPKVGIAAGASWSFKFDQVGTWRYHDHLNPTRFGSVVVTE